MPIYGIKQPETIEVDENIRLRRFYASFDFALPWYIDPETVYLVDGVKKPYDMDHLEEMYHYLYDHGELYFIEYKSGDNFRPIGDVTFSDDDLTIVIGDVSYRNMGIGKKVIKALIERAKQLGYATLHVKEIYDFNTASKMCFESVGFVKENKTNKGYSYILNLK